MHPNEEPQMVRPELTSQTYTIPEIPHLRRLLRALASRLEFNGGGNRSVVRRQQETPPGITRLECSYYRHVSHRFVSSADTAISPIPVLCVRFPPELH